MEEKQEQKEYHKWLMQICLICGKEFACNKTHHVYIDRKSTRLNSSHNA